jgi:hypothetical protein
MNFLVSDFVVSVMHLASCDKASVGSSGPGSRGSCRAIGGRGARRGRTPAPRLASGLGARCGQAVAPGP